MSDRYSRVFSLPENLYAAESPIVIEAGALQKDNQTGNVIAQLKMKNISATAIKAVKVKLTLFDVAGNVLADGVEWQYLDLRVSRDESFGSKSAIRLKESTTRSFAVNIIEVVFEDESVWSGTENPWETLSEPAALINYFDDYELEKQFELKYGSPCHNVLLEEKDLWHCTCGAWNKDHEIECHKCGKVLKNLKELDVSVLKAEKEKRLEAERILAEKKAERNRQEEELAKIKAVEKTKKTKKIAIIAIPVLCILILSVIGFNYLWNNVLVPNGQYRDAVALMDSGNYDEAIMAFEALNGYKDSVAQIDACYRSQYDNASALMNQGNYEAAIEIFTHIQDYDDSKNMIKQCKYQAAEALLVNGDREGAVTAFESIKGYKDSNAQVEKIKAELMYEKYGPVIELLKKNEWFLNGGSDTILQKIKFTDSKANVSRITFDGNGKHSGGAISYTYDISDQFITVAPGSSSEIILSYKVNGNTITLNNGACMAKDQVKQDLQGGWRYRDNSFGLTHEYNVIISGNTIKFENANEGFNLGYGQYYYYGPFSGTFTVGDGSINSNMTHGNEFFFNILNGKATLLHYHHAFTKKSMSKLPGLHGYNF